MGTFIYTSFITLSLLVSTATTAGNSKALDQRAAPTLKEQLVGAWVREMGKASDAFHSTTTLDLHADGTMTLDNLMVGANTGKIENKAEGRWAAEDKTVTVTLERSSDGREIPAGQKTLKLTVETDSSGAVIGLNSPESGTPYKRQAAPAKWLAKDGGVSPVLSMATVVSKAKFVPSVERETLKPVAVAELLYQPKSISVAASAVRASLDKN